MTCGIKTIQQTFPRGRCTGQQIETSDLPLDSFLLRGTTEKTKMPLDQADPYSLYLFSKYKKKGPPPFHHVVSTVDRAFGVRHFQSGPRKARLLH